MRRFYVFMLLAHAAGRSGACHIKGMNIWLIVLAIQVIAAIVALVRESGEDTRFQGDKLGYRS